VSGWEGGVHFGWGDEGIEEEFFAVEQNGDECGQHVEGE